MACKSENGVLVTYALRQDELSLLQMSEKHKPSNEPVPGMDDVQMHKHVFVS